MENKLKELEREKWMVHRKIVQTYLKILDLNDMNMNTYHNIPIISKSKEVQNKFKAIDQRKKCIRKLIRRRQGYIKQEMRLKFEIEYLKEIINNELEINDILEEWDNEGVFRKANKNIHFRRS